MFPIIVETVNWTSKKRSYNRIYFDPSAKKMGFVLVCLFQNYYCRFVVFVEAPDLLSDVLASNGKYASIYRQQL